MLDNVARTIRFAGASGAAAGDDLPTDHATITFLEKRDPRVLAAWAHLRARNVVVVDPIVDGRVVEVRGLVPDQPTGFRMTQTERETWDAIVIGSGLGGMTAAAAVSKTAHAARRLAASLARARSTGASRGSPRMGGTRNANDGASRWRV